MSGYNAAYEKGSDNESGQCTACSHEAREEGVSRERGGRVRTQDVE